MLTQEFEETQMMGIELKTQMCLFMSVWVSFVFYLKQQKPEVFCSHHKHLRTILFHLPAT